MLRSRVCVSGLLRSRLVKVTIWCGHLLCISSEGHVLLKLQDMSKYMYIHIDIIKQYMIGSCWFQNKSTKWCVIRKWALARRWSVSTDVGLLRQCEPSCEREHCPRIAYCSLSRAHCSDSNQAAPCRWVC